MHRVENSKINAEWYESLTRKLSFSSSPSANMEIALPEVESFQTVSFQQRIDKF